MFNSLTGNILLFLLSLVIILAFIFFLKKRDLKNIISLLIPITAAFLIRIIIAFIFVYAITLPARYTSDQSLYDEYSYILSAQKDIRTFPAPRISRFTSKISIFSGAKSFSFRLVVITISMLGLMAIFNIFITLYKGLKPGVFWILALFPSLILWQSFHLKDGLLAAFVAINIYALICFFNRKIKIVYAFLIFVTLGGVYFMRPYWAVCLAAATGAAFTQFILSRAFPDFKWALPTSIAFFIGLATAFFFKMPVEIIQKIHNNMTVGAATMIYPNLQFNSILDVLLYVPKGAAAFLFMPWPWAAQPTVFHSLTALDSLLCLLFIPAGLIEIIYLSLSSKDDDIQLVSVALLTLMLCLIFFHAIIEGNVGTAFRHRIIIIQFMIIPGLFLLNRLLKFFELQSSED